MFSLDSIWLIFRMRELGENEALLVKQVDSAFKCGWSWAWLMLDANRGERNATHFPSQWIKRGMPGVLSA
jgi:hypothetical protein